MTTASSNDCYIPCLDYLTTAQMSSHGFDSLLDVFKGTKTLKEKKH